MLPIRAERLCFSRNGQPLFHEFSFDTKEHRRIGIMGSTGAGKTSLLKMLAGFIQPDSGTIWVGEDRVLGPNEQLIAGHKWIGYLSQHYELRNNYFVKELLDMAGKLSPERMEEVIDLCHIRHLLQRRTDALSGGERQRIALARVLLTDPKWLLLDEPYSNLDLNQKRTIMQLINEIGTKLNVSLIMVSHDAADMLSWADELMIIDHGKVVQCGAPKELYDHPLNEHVAGLLGEYNVCDAWMVSLLTHQENIYVAGKQYLIRPEYIFISIDEKGIKVNVKEILFKGGYYLVRCQIKEQNSMIIISVPPATLVHVGAATFIYTLPEYVVHI